MNSLDAIGNGAGRDLIQCRGCQRLFSDLPRYKSHQCAGDPPELVTALRDSLDILCTLNATDFTPSEQRDLALARQAIGRVQESVLYRGEL